MDMGKDFDQEDIEKLVEDVSSYEVNFFIFGIFRRLHPDQAITVLRNRHQGFFELKVKRFFSELEKVGIDEASCRRFIETTEGVHPDELSDFSVLVFHTLNSIDELNKAQIIGWIFIQLICKEISLDTAIRLVRAVQRMYYKDLIKLGALPLEDCLADQLFLDSSVAAGILTALEKGRYTDHGEFLPLAYRLNFVGKELMTIIKNGAPRVQSGIQE